MTVTVRLLPPRSSLIVTLVPALRPSIIETTSSEDVITAISGHKPGDKVTLGIERGGSSRSVHVTLAQQPTQAPSNG